MEPDSQIRNLRDFLMVYNRMTEICFQKCSSNFNYRNLTMDEERCVDNCAGKLIRSNHRLMGTYVQLMPRMVQRRMDEMEAKSKALEAESAAAGATATALTPPSVPPTSETDLTPTSQPPALTTLAGTHILPTPPPATLGVAMDFSVTTKPGGNLETPDIPAMVSLAELDFPANLVPSGSMSIAPRSSVAENKMAAATSITSLSSSAAVEAKTALPSSLTEAVREAAFTPLVKPVSGLVETVKPPGPPAEGLSKTINGPALISSNNVSLAPSVAPSFRAKQDVPPPS